MMNCKKLAELLLEFCDGELGKEYCDLICQHIRLCGPCHSYMDSYKVTIRMTRQLPPVAIPQHLIDKVRAALEKDEKA